MTAEERTRLALQNASVKSTGTVQTVSGGVAQRTAQALENAKAKTTAKTSQIATPTVTATSPATNSPTSLIELARQNNGSIWNAGAKDSKVGLALEAGVESGVGGSLGALQTAGQFLGKKASDIFGTEKYLSNPENRAFVEKAAEMGAFGNGGTAKGEPVLSADKLMAASATDLAKAKEGTGKIGSFALDAISTGANMGTALAGTLLFGLPYSASMGIQAGGSAALNAKAQGKSLEQQTLYGLTSGLSEAAIESIGGIGASQALKGAAAKGASALLGKLSPKLATALGKVASSTLGKIFGSAVSEASEEAVSYQTDRFLQGLILGNDVPNDVKEMAYQALIGGTMGGVFSGGQVIGQNIAQSKAPSQTVQNAPESKQAATLETTLKGGTSVPAAVETAATPVSAEDAYSTSVSEQEKNIATLEKELETENALFHNLYAEYRSTDIESRRPELLSEAQAQQKKIKQAESKLKKAQDTLAQFKEDSANAEKAKAGTAKITEIMSNFKDRFISESALSEMEKVGEMKEDVSTLRKAYDGAIQAQTTVNKLTKQLAASESLLESAAIQSKLDKANEKLDKAAQALQAAQEKIISYSNTAEQAASPLSATKAEGKKQAPAPKTLLDVARENAQKEAPKQNLLEQPATQQTEQKERGFSENVRTDQYTNPELKKSFDTSPETYEVLANAETKATADAEFSSNSSTENYANIKARIAANELKPSDIPLARMTANQLVEEGKFKEARELLADVAVKLTEAGQLSQAANILRQSDPATVLASVQKQIQKINEAGRKKYGKRWKDFSLTDDEMQAITKINTGDTVAIQAVVEMVGKRIGSQIPFTGWQKVTEFRRVAMLLNPKTQVRNILGNVPLMGLRKASETLAAGIQDVAVSMGIMDKADQTRTLRVSKQSKAIAKELFDQQKSALLNADKWDLKSIARDNQKVFKTVPLETLRNFTYSLLEKGDLPFLRSAFIDNAASYIEAQGYISAYDVPQKVIDKAAQNALVATFRDSSALAQWLNGMKSNGGIGGAALDVLFPFTTTPINIAKRTVDYSPAGALKLLSINNRSDAVKVIDTLTQSATGTAVIALGFLLAKLGWITGGEDKDYDKAAFLKAIGQEPYSIMGKYTYDWAQPVGTSLAIGAEAYKAAQGDTDLINAIMNSLYAGGDALLNLTFFSNIEDLFSSYGSTSERTAETLVKGLGSQLIPSIFGQTARTADDTVRSTYTGGNIFQDMLAQAKAKTPGASSTLPASVDVRGQEKKRLENPFARLLEQTVSPGTINAGGSTATDNEIQRVYETTGDSAVFPRYASGYFTNNGVKYTMNGEERSQFQKTLGQNTYFDLEGLFKNSEYKSATDGEKAEMIADVIAAANDMAKEQLVESRGEMYLDSDGVKKVQTYSAAAGIDEKTAYGVYEALDTLEPLEGKKTVSDAQKTDAVLAYSGITQGQKTKLVSSILSDTSRESLVGSVDMSDKLVELYKETGDLSLLTSYLSVPSSFEIDKVAHKLTETEKKIYRERYLEIFNDRVNRVFSAQTTKAKIARLEDLKDDAATLAKKAVIKSMK